MPPTIKSPKDALRTFAAQLERHLASKSPIPEAELELAKVAFLAAKRATQRSNAVANRKQQMFPSDFGIVGATPNSPELRQRIGRLLTKAYPERFWTEPDLALLSAAIAEGVTSILSPKQSGSSTLVIREYGSPKLDPAFDMLLIASVITSAASRHGLPLPIPDSVIESITRLVRKTIRRQASQAKASQKVASKAKLPRRGHRTSSGLKATK